MAEFGRVLLSCREEGWKGTILRRLQETKHPNSNWVITTPANAGHVEAPRNGTTLQHVALTQRILANAYGWEFQEVHCILYFRWRIIWIQRGFVKVYLDDIVIYSDKTAEHAKHLRLVLERLRTYKLNCHLKKCRFALRTRHYKQRQSTAHETHEQLRSYPVPKNAKQVRSFLVTAGWMREFIPRFSEIAAPLTDLTEKKRKFVWTPAAQEPIDLLKAETWRSLTLSRPDPHKRMILQTDRFKLGMAAVLYQEVGERRYIIFQALAKFKDAEKKYHINEAECSQQTHLIMFL